MAQVFKGFQFYLHTNIRHCGIEADMLFCNWCISECLMMMVVVIIDGRIDSISLHVLHFADDSRSYRIYTGDHVWAAEVWRPASEL